jgi:LPXTG-site transpeptidase (sortase) family protein
VGVNAGGTTNGLDATFTTSAINPPIVTTNAATAVTTTTATLNGTVNANNDSTAVTFEYGLTAAYGTTVVAVPSPITGNANTAVSAAITGLTPNTLYHFRVVGVNAGGTTNGLDATFTTNAIVITYPTVSATTPSDNAILPLGPTQIVVQFNKDVLHNGSADAADNLANYLLVEIGSNHTFDTLSCAGGLAPDDRSIVINTVTYTNNAGAGPFVATLNINGGVALPVGSYRLFVCGTKSIHDAAGNVLNNGLDSRLTFSVQLTQPQNLPATGFAPDRVTVLAAQPADQAYASLGTLWLEIPTLGVKMSIVGVPQSTTGWDVSWLGSQAGWLQGTAFPTWVGNSVLTAHVTNANGKNGPFAGLKNLMYGDRIIVHMQGQQYIYEVRDTRTLTAGNPSYVFQSLDKYSYLTLMTCQGYNPLSDKYTYRRVVRAVLVSVTADK